MRLLPKFKKGGICIKPENKGKFTETKERTGKTTEELTHSKNPLTRKRAVFAQNATKWKHANGGTLAEKVRRVQNNDLTFSSKEDYDLNAPAIQDTLETNKQLMKYRNNPNYEVIPGGVINNPKIRDYIKSKWEYPYTNYAIIKDKLSGQTYYYPQLTNIDLAKEAASRGKIVLNE